MSGRSGQAEIRVAFIELFDLGGRFDKRQGRRDAEEEEGTPRDQVGLIDGRTTKRKDAACRKRQQIVNNFLERPRGWKALSYHLALIVSSGCGKKLGNRRGFNRLGSLKKNEKSED
ncbi:uncharacterized protein TNIN_457541 [Trichonephila inaurata madagascariensis]|uniref:Uncharacterized protein n=1 Tax=Trichonephila inaurata madagascariensis TaxID=2747483 RepID=A0A8X6X1B3_9ARAC|nr:uncharacterized protein TNIN_457541 [Trichonephila inaurata madagascariensis]